MNKIFTLILFAVSVLPGWAQSTFQSQEFVINPYPLSPSNSGFNGNHEIFAGFSTRFTGVQGAPITTWADYNGIIKNNSGIGFMVYYETFGVFRNARVDLSYAYHLLIAKQHRLSLGLSFSLNQTRLDFSNSNSDPLNDPAVMSAGTKAGIAFNAGLGLTYSFKGLMVSVAMPFIINNNQGQAYTLYSQPQSLLYYAAYDIALNKLWDIKPLLVINQIFNAPINYSAILSTRYKRMLWLNLGFSAQSMFSAGIGVEVIDRLTFQYTYQFSFNGIVNASGGNHELVLGILIGRLSETRSANSVFQNSRQNPYYEWQ